MIYSLPYLLFTALFVLLAWWYHVGKTEETRRRIVWICVAVLMLFFGFRGFIFHDWMSYYPYFIGLDLDAFSQSDVFRGEKGFALLMYVCKWICPHYQFFVFVCTAINVWLLMRFLMKHVENIPLAIVFVFTVGGLTIFTDLMRNAVAILVLLNALDYLHQRKPWQYFGLVVVGVLFHYTAVLMIPVYFFMHRQINRWVLAGCFVVCTIIYVLHVPVLEGLVGLILDAANPDLKAYLHVYLEEEGMKQSGLNFVFFERMAVGIAVLCFLDKLRSQRDDANIYINGFFIYVCSQLFVYEFVTVSVRVSMPFFFGAWMMWLELAKCWRYENNRRLFLFVLIAYCFLRVYGQTRDKLVVEYDNVLFEADTFTERSSIFNKTN